MSDQPMKDGESASREQRTAEVAQLGDDIVVLLPRDVVAALRVEPGDRLRLTRAADGYHLSHPEFERQMAKAREIMDERRGLLRELAK